jgi:segregation and condensation protein A
MEMLSERSARGLPPPTSNFVGIVGREPYPVTKKAAEVLKKLISRGVARFLSLFKGSRSRSEIVATFLAVLELIKGRRIMVEGISEDYEDCRITLIRNKEEADEASPVTAE